MTKDIMTSGIEMSDVIKATGFPVPEDMEGKTFAEVVEGGGSGDITVEPLNVTENGTYTAPEGKAYSPVTVNVEGGSVPLYAWRNNDFNSIISYTYTENPSVGDTIVGCEYGDMDAGMFEVENAITATGENQITVTDSNPSVRAGTYTRDSTKDIVLQAGEGGSVIVEPLSVTANGTYTAPSGEAYSPITVNVPSVSGFAIEFENGDSDGYIFSKVIAFGTAQAVGDVIPAGTYNAFFVTDDIVEGDTHDFTDIPHLFQTPANVSASQSGYNPTYYTVTISEDVTPVNSGEYGTVGRHALLVLYPSNM